MLMTDDEKPDLKAADQPHALRDSIVRRLKAHDAAVRSTLSTETPKKTTPTKNQ